MDWWVVIALFTIPFLAGFVSGFRIAKYKFIIFLLKKLNPREFEKLMEDEEQTKNENEGCESSDTGKVYSVSTGKTN